MAPELDVAADEADHLAEAADAPRPGGPLRRLIATLLDMGIFCGLCALLATPVTRAIHWTALPVNLQEVTDAVSDPTWISHASGVLGMWIALWWCYFAVGWGLFGATPGKRLCGLEIIDHQHRCPIGLTRGVLRLVAYSVSSFTFGIGHLMVVFRPDRCALHDILAGTRVVRRRKGPGTRD
jgi:uncharacterized RDD family membrane protein YckC